MAQSSTAPRHVLSSSVDRFRRCCAVLVVGALLLACVGLAAGAANPKRVLIIHSFGRDFAPYDTITTATSTSAPENAQLAANFECQSTV